MSNHISEKFLMQTVSDKTYPDYILDLLKEAETLKMTSNYKEAIKIIKQVLCEEPECLIAYEELSDNYLILNKDQKARKAAEFALSLFEDSFVAHYVIGFIELKNENWDDAYNHLLKADKLHVNNPEILRCLGWSLFKKGKCSKGIIILERVLTMLPEDPITLCDLGVCYFELQHFCKAMDLFSCAVEVEPDNIRAQEMIKVTESVVQKLSKKSCTPHLVNKN